MPTIEVTEDQLDRLEAVRADVSEALAGPYGHVRTRDAVEYLLDTYSPPAESGVESAPSADDAATAPEPSLDTGGAVGESDDAGLSGAPDDAGPTDSGGDAGADRLSAMMSLLDEHEDKWRESGGDEPYEVDLPDGSTDTARTKDDVRGLLFRHYR